MDPVVVRLQRLLLYVCMFYRLIETSCLTDTISLLLHDVPEMLAQQIPDIVDVSCLNQRRTPHLQLLRSLLIL